MTLAHIAALYFDNKREMTKKRVQKLKAAGYLRERARQRTAPSILTLTRNGFEWLHRHGALPDSPRLSLAEFERRGRVSELTLRHELEVIDVKTALTCAITCEQSFRIAFHDILRVEFVLGARGDHHLAELESITHDQPPFPF